MDFETGDFSDWTTELWRPHSGEIVTSPVRCGQYAARFEIRQGDVGLLDKYRAEVTEFPLIAPMPLQTAFENV